MRKTFSSGVFCCFAAPIALGSGEMKFISSLQKHRFEMDSGMTMQQVYDFAYKEWYIPAMKNIMAQVGREKFLEMLKKSSDMLNETEKDPGIDYNERTITAFTDGYKKLVEGYYKQRNTIEFIHSDENVLEVNCTECIWAKTFREADAAEIGYAGICYSDYSAIKGYNPKMKLVREKTLMQGHDCCNFKIVMES